MGSSLNRRALGLLLSLCLAACVPKGASNPEAGSEVPALPGPSPRKPVFNFPGKFGPGAPPPEVDPLVGENSPPVWEWTFRSAAPVNKPWTASLSRIVLSTTAQSDTQLNCLAHEVARAVARLGSLGDARFRSYLALHCGLSSSAVNIQYAGGDAPAELSDSKLWAAVSEANLEAAVKELVQSGASRLGIGLAREGAKATWALVGQRDDVALSSVTPEPDASNLVHIEGSAAGALDQLRVVVNHGKYGARECNVALENKRFFATCPMDPNDETAWFDVLRAGSERLLFRAVARGEARRKPLTLTYQRPAESDDVAVPFAKGVAQELNRIRQSAGLGPLKLSQAQSKVVSAFLPHVANTTESTSAYRETDLTLGLLAGWKLKANIRTGQSYLHSAATKSPRAWIAECLEFPMARTVLLGKGNQVLSIGGMPWGTHGTIGIVATHTLYTKEDDHSADLTVALRRLHKARVAAGKPPFEMGPPTVELQQAALAVRDHGVAPEGAIEYAARSLVQGSLGQVRTLHVEGYTFDALTFPPELVQLRGGKLRAVVTHYHPDDAAWGQLALLVLIESEE